MGKIMTLNQKIPKMKMLIMKKKTMLKSMKKKKKTLLNLLLGDCLTLNQ